MRVGRHRPPSGQVPDWPSPVLTIDAGSQALSVPHPHTPHTAGLRPSAPCSTRRSQSRPQCGNKRTCPGSPEGPNHLGTLTCRPLLPASGPGQASAPNTLHDGYHQKVLGAMGCPCQGPGRPGQQGAWLSTSWLGGGVAEGPATWHTGTPEPSTFSPKHSNIWAALGVPSCQLGSQIYHLRVLGHRPDGRAKTMLFIPLSQTQPSRCLPPTWGRF